MEYFLDSIRTVKNIFKRLKNRDFSGYTGLTIKNSIFQVSTTIISKIGALIFTIILARLLMPELFGLYSLALSTILIFVAFSDFGMGETLVRFVSRELGRKNIPTVPRKNGLFRKEDFLFRLLRRQTALIILLFGVILFQRI